MNLLSDVLQRDPQIAQEIAARSEHGPARSAESGMVNPERLRDIANRRGMSRGSTFSGPEEAVILWQARPSLPIQDDAFSLPQSPLWRERLAAAEGKLRSAILATGRVELFDHPFNAMTPYMGTAWLIAEDVLVTNRHVAQAFVWRDGSQLVFAHNPQTNGPTEARVDFKEELGSVSVSAREVGILEVLAIEPAPGADMAFFRIRRHPLLPSPIGLVNHEEGEFIATIGYPGNDPRADAARLATIFTGGYGVKRLAPGQIMPGAESGRLYHDASTLKGSSGSVVLSLATGKAVGLHFAGRFGERNEAVSAGELYRLLAELKILPTTVSLERGPQPAEPEDAEPECVTTRAGYQPDFLGAAQQVPLPALELPESRAALDYTHFSIVMHSERNLAMCAACNIDGGQLRRVPRANTWRFDGRIDIGAQHGNALYSRNDYDRGHLVRRLDPVWGEAEEAERANDDSFFYTNSAPQHSRLNQKFWLGLEDYILDNAAADRQRISVFTGCVFDRGDPRHRGVQIPRQFWKIVAFNAADTGQLRASGYLMDQSHLIEEIPEEFAFGAFKTYQVSIGRIAAVTGIDLELLRKADVLNSDTESFALMPITAFEEIQF